MLRKLFKQQATTFRSGFRRFALTIFWLTALTLCLLLLNHKVLLTEEASIPLVVGLVNAALLSLMLKLTLETSDNRLRKVVCHLVGYVLVAALSVYLFFLQPFNIIEVTLLLGVESALVAAVFIVPLWREHTDLPLWNLLMRALVSVVASVIAVGVLVLGLNLLFLFICMLFQINMGFDLPSDITIIGFTWLVPVVMLQFVPKAQNLHNTGSNGLPGKLQNLVRFVLVPLLFVYVLTLYVYAAKILFTWQLPNGDVSWPVSIMMALQVAVVILLFPSLHHPEKCFDNKMFQWLPVATLPLLVLMTVAIGRRLSDYGISVPRLYVLTFNLWCYAVCILMIIPKTRQRILTIGISSFALVLLLASAGPWSFSNVVYRNYRNSVEESLQAAHLPNTGITKQQLESCIQRMNRADRLQFMSRLNTLRDAYNKYGLEDRLSEDAWLMTQNYSYQEEKERDNYVDTDQFYFTDITDTQIPVPAGSKSVVKLDYHEAEVTQSNDDAFTLRTTIKGKQRDFVFDMKKEPKFSVEGGNAWIIEGHSQDAVLFIIRKKGVPAPKKGKSYSFNGILFLK